MKKETLNPQKAIESIVGRFTKATMKKPALAPGTLVYVGEKRKDPVSISLMDYDVSHISEKKLGAVDEVAEYLDKTSVSWIDVDGVHDTKVIETIGAHFKIHPLVLEDIVHTSQRPKMEEHEGYFYIVAKMLTYDEAAGGVQEEQVSFLLGKNFLLSFQEQSGDVFNPVRERVRGPKLRAKDLGADYLLYTLLDAVVDHYFFVLEKIGFDIEALEEKVTTDSTPQNLEKIYKMKREMLFIKKNIWPLRELLSDFLHHDSDLLHDEVKVYMRDVYDHTIQIVEIVESFRDMLSGIQDLYLSMVSNRMNDVMKVLTIIATVFIPPTFIAGIYGMNFVNMPELQSPNGYFIALGAMFISISGMLLYFKKKNWF